MIEQHAVMSSILNSYRSLSEPRYDFVQTSLQHAKADALVDRLSSLGLEVKDVGDSNDDVCRFICVAGDGEQFQVLVSLVGPFAAVSTGVDARVFLSQEEVMMLQVGDRLIEYLGQEDICIVPPNLLSTRIPVNLVDLSENDASMFQVLFTTC